MIVLKKIRIKELSTGLFDLENVEIEIGEIEEEWEPQGPTPKPGIADLRSWDFKLLSRYAPLYSPICDMCCLCTYGKCDLSDNKRGACGIDLKTQQARMLTLQCCIGAAAHAAHARHMVEHLIKHLGRDYPIDLGLNIQIEAPITRVVVGIKPKTLADLEKALDYVEEQITHVLSSTHTGQEGSAIDYESKALHVSMVDNLAKEIADVAQIVGYNFPKGDADAPLVDIGIGAIDKEKPVILCIGHNVAPGAVVIDYLEKENLLDKIEVCGICCTAIDITRRSDSAKIVGSLARQLEFVRLGIADVIMLDEQCVRTDVYYEAKKVKTPVIATCDKICLGLKDRTKDSVNSIVVDLVSGKEDGVLILDPEKAGEVAVKVAQMIAPLRKDIKALPSKEEVIQLAKECISCYHCQRACERELPIPQAMREAAKGNLSLLAELRELCIFCARCESACKKGLPITKMFTKASIPKIKEEKYKVRVGRGPVQDVEIRNVGGPIVLGEIPGVILFAGCANYPNGYREVAEMAHEFLKRRYIVTATGCSAMDIAMYKTENGKSLYEEFPGDFDAGCLVNIGSCVANAHVVGAAIKIPAIFGRRNLRGNFEEIADYIYNRVGAVAIVWGTMSQKAISISTGANRWGVPVIFGPQGLKYKRSLLGRKELWKVYDARSKEEVLTDPAPLHLAYSAETKEEAMVMATKLCIRPNDTTKGRQIKLTHYIDLHERFFGSLPDDLHLYIRCEADIPLTKKETIMKILKEKGWKPRKIPDPTLLEVKK